MGGSAAAHSVPTFHGKGWLGPCSAFRCLRRIALCPKRSEAISRGAGCGNSACPDLRGGRSGFQRLAVPTATSSALIITLGGVLRNKNGERFMFGDIPDNYKSQTADTPEEGWRYTQGDKQARRPPELLTRDHVARCIVRETKEGRGTPHGGVYLDIAWIKEKLSNSEEHIKRK